MAIKARISRAWLLKGKSSHAASLTSGALLTDSCDSFGWVNASYVYGLQIVSEHMKRALGAVTSWDTFQKMTNAGSAKEAADVLHEARLHDQEDAGKLSVAEHVHRAAAASSHGHEHETNHKAT